MVEQFKVGKNLVSKEEDGWLVEIFEYENNEKPMYSVFDTYKNKEDAIKVAKRVNKDNAYRMERLYSHNLDR